MISSTDSLEDGSIVDLVGDDDLRKEISARYKLVDAYYAAWDETAKEDYAFALGDQWEEEDRKALKKQGRPCLTFNRIRPVINIIAGYQRENSARIKVSPEGGEDKIFSEVCDKILHFIDKRSHLTYKLGYQFDDGLYCGKGLIEAKKTYDNDPVRGELDFVLLPPYSIKAAPEFREYNFNDGCPYLFKVKPYTKGKLKELFPNKTKIIDALHIDSDKLEDNFDVDMIDKPGSTYENDDYGNRPWTANSQSRISGKIEEPELETDRQFLLKEYWRPKMVNKYFVVNAETGEPERFDTQEEAQAMVDRQNETLGMMTDQFSQPSDNQNFKIITRKVPEMWVADMVAGVILQDIKSPFEPEYSGYPIFRFLADWAPNASNEILRVQGMTRQLKDPQKEKNKSKSQYLHILNTQANSGWIGDKEALTEEGWRELEQMGSKPGITIKKKKGYELTEIQPKGPNQGHLIREQQADEEFKQISSVNPDLLGLQEGTESGKAIALRVKQAVLSLTRYFSNYRYTKEILGDFILSQIPAMFDVKKVSKILGPSFMQKAIDPERYPEGINEGHLGAFLTMIKDDRYDLLVTEADAQSTIRNETFMDLIEIAKIGIPIPPDLMIEFMDIPNSDEVIGRVKAYQQQQMALQQTGVKK